MKIVHVTRLLALSLGFSGLLIGCDKPAPPAPAAETASAPTPGLTPVVSVNELMVTMIDNAAHVLWDVEVKGQEPKNDADWLELEDHAIQVAAAGTLIQLGGTGPSDAGWAKQPGWKNSSEQMTKAALAVRDAAKGRKLDGVVEANGKLVEACEACHTQFKGDLPTEGLLHQRPHSESHR
jgi:hypothetical protein